MHYIYGDGEKILTKAVNLEKDFLGDMIKDFFSSFFHPRVLVYFL